MLGRSRLEENLAGTGVSAVVRDRIVEELGSGAAGASAAHASDPSNAAHLARAAQEAFVYALSNSLLLSMAVAAAGAIVALALIRSSPEGAVARGPRSGQRTRRTNDRPRRRRRRSASELANDLRVESAHRKAGKRERVEVSDQDKRRAQWPEWVTPDYFQHRAGSGGFEPRIGMHVHRNAPLFAYVSAGKAFFTRRNGGGQRWKRSARRKSLLATFACGR